MLTRGETRNGLTVFTFVDFYGQSCSLQESSLATEEAIWIGRDSDATACRMHLTREHVQNLLPMLAHFAETGELPEGS